MRGFGVAFGWLVVFFLNTLALRFLTLELISSKQTTGNVFKNYYLKLNIFLHLVSHQKFSYEESLSLPASSFLCDVMN